MSRAALDREPSGLLNALFRDSVEGREGLGTGVTGPTGTPQTVCGYADVRVRLAAALALPGRDAFAHCPCGEEERNGRVDP
jgi:hypothetical protein